MSCFALPSLSSSINSVDSRFFPIIDLSRKSFAKYRNSVKFFTDCQSLGGVSSSSDVAASAFTFILITSGIFLSSDKL